MNFVDQEHISQVGESPNGIVSAAQFIVELSPSGVERIGKNDRLERNAKCFLTTQSGLANGGTLMHLTVLLDAPRCRTDGTFLIRDVPGTSGRLDVVCRVLLSTFRTVPELCSNLQFFAVFGGPPTPPLQLQVKDVTPKSFPESELDCSLILKALLQQFSKSQQTRHNNWPEFSLAKKGFAEILKEERPVDGHLFYLIERGKPLEETPFSFERPTVIVLGDDQGLPGDHEEILYQYKVQEVSVGTRSLLGSQAISLLLLNLASRLNAS